jgi:hypothetical protein
MGTAAVQEVKGPVSKLGKVHKGRIKIARRCIFYGPEGVGKTTLAAGAPDPIWFDVEDGSALVNVARYPFRDEAGGHVPNSYQDLVAAVDDLTRNPHGYKTLVIDTLDAVEAMLWRFIVERDKGKVKGGLENIEDYGYAKGYQVAVDEWRAFCARLDVLRRTRSMQIILLAHARVSTFKNPEGDDFERYTLQVHDKAAGFLKSWSEVVGFCRFEEGGAKLAGAKKAKGWSTGRRVIHLARAAAYDGKGRGGMPAELEMDPADPWGAFQKALDDSDNMSPEALAALIAAETARIGDAELTAKVDAACAAAVVKNDTETLNRYLQDLKRRESKGAVTQ